MERIQHPLKSRSGSWWPGSAGSAGQRGLSTTSQAAAFSVLSSLFRVLDLGC